MIFVVLILLSFVLLNKTSILLLKVAGLQIFAWFLKFLEIFGFWIFALSLFLYGR